MADIDLRKVLPLQLTWLAGLALAWGMWDLLGTERFGQDAHAYWAAWQGEWRTDMYDIAPGHLDAFNYSPVFALATWPLAQLPFWAFVTLWTTACVAALVWLLLPLGMRWVPPLLLLSAPEILTGNVFWLMALVCVVGTLPRRPGTRQWHGGWWSVIALTKLTPALGPIWFLVRREWRPLTASVVVSAVLIVGSALLVPDLWRQWFEFLIDNEASGSTVGSTVLPPLLYRLPVAVLLTAYAAWSDRVWLLPVAVVLACPVAGLAVFVVLAAIPRLLQRRRALTPASG